MESRRCDLGAERAHTRPRRHTHTEASVRTDGGRGWSSGERRMAVREVLSVRERRKAVENGYQYVFDKFSRDATKKYWRCDRKNDRCPARLHTDAQTGQVLKRMHSHDHASNAVGVQAAIVRNAIKRRASQTDTIQTTPSQLITHEVISLGLAAMEHLATNDSLRRIIQRQRKKKFSSTSGQLLSNQLSHNSLVERSVQIANNGGIKLEVSEPSAKQAKVEFEWPKVDMDTMTLRHARTGDELSQSEIAVHLARALLLLPTTLVNKQKMRMLGPDWIQVVDDADILESIDTLVEVGLLEEPDDTASCSDSKMRMPKNCIYRKVPSAGVDEESLQDFGISLQLYAASFS